jgi:hypothetical protein
MVLRSLAGITRNLVNEAEREVEREGRREGGWH